MKLADYRSFCSHDRQSRDVLANIGFVDEADPVYPDLAFSLPETMFQRPARRARSRRKVAVGVYDYKGRGTSGGAAAAAYAGYLEKLAAFVSWLHAHDYDVRIILGDLTYDEAVVRDLRAVLDAKGTAGDRVEDEPARSVDQVVGQIADVDFVVASRFHNVLLSLLVGRPTVSISYNAKNDALMTDVGLGDYCQSVEDFEVDRLVQHFQSLERSAEPLMRSVATKVGSYRRDLAKQYGVLFEAVGAARR